MNTAGKVLIAIIIALSASILTMDSTREHPLYSILSPEQTAWVANTLNSPDIAVFGIWRTPDYDHQTKNRILSKSRDMMKKSISENSNYRLKSQLESDGLIKWIDATNYAFFRDILYSRSSRYSQAVDLAKIGNFEAVKYALSDIASDPDSANFSAQRGTVIVKVTGEIFLNKSVSSSTACTDYDFHNALIEISRQGADFYYFSEQDRRTAIDFFTKYCGIMDYEFRYAIDQNFRNREDRAARQAERREARKRREEKRTSDFHSFRALLGLCANNPSPKCSSRRSNSGNSPFIYDSRGYQECQQKKKACLANCEGFSSRAQNIWMTSPRGNCRHACFQVCN